MQNREVIDVHFEEVGNIPVAISADVRLGQPLDISPPLKRHMAIAMNKWREQFDADAMRFMRATGLDVSEIEAVVEQTGAFYFRKRQLRLGEFANVDGGGI